MNLEIIAYKAILENQNSNIDKEKEALILLFNTIQKSSSQLLRVSDYNIVGTAYFLMGNHSCFMNNEDFRRIIADNAFYCFSKAIDNVANNEYVRIKRLLMLQNFYKDFYYTIANAMNIPDDGLDDILIIGGGMPLIVKTNDYYYNMLEHDFAHVSQSRVREIDSINQLYQTLRNRFGSYSSQKGEEYINKIIAYLETVYSKY